MIKTIESEIERLRILSKKGGNEEAVVFSGDGRYLETIIGEDESVMFSLYDDFQDCIILHNHSLLPSSDNEHAKFPVALTSGDYCTAFFFRCRAVIGVTWHFMHCFVVNDRAKCSIFMLEELSRDLTRIEPWGSRAGHRLSLLDIARLTILSESVPGSFVYWF